jgi:hypothetical protein
MRLLTNHTNAQTANSAIVTTNQLTVFEVTQAGAVTWGASGSASSSSQAHVVNGGINAGATGTGDAFRRAMINANAYTFGDAWGSARNSNSNTLGGCFLEVSARTSDSSECLRVYANRIADGNTTNPTLIMYGTQAGAFAFGPTTETVTNVSKGRFTATWNDNSNASSAALESYRKSSTATHYMMVMYSDVGSTGALKWRAEADGDTISATGSYTSDARAKKNLSPIQYGLNEILQLAPKSFNWWYEDDSETPNFCASTAQEIEMLMPELVRDDGLSGPNGIQMKAVYEKELVPVLIKAMQELHAELQIAKERITILEGGQ